MSPSSQPDRTRAALLIAGWSPSPRRTTAFRDEADPMSLLKKFLDEVGTVNAAHLFNTDHDTVLSWQEGALPHHDMWSRLTAVTGTSLGQWARAAARDREARWAKASVSSHEESPVDDEEHNR